MEKNPELADLRVIADARRALDIWHEGVSAGIQQAEHPLLHAWLQAYCKVWVSEQTEKNMAKTTPRKSRRVLSRIHAQPNLLDREDTILCVVVQTDSSVTGVVLPQPIQGGTSIGLTHALQDLRGISENIVYPRVSDLPTDRYPSIKNPNESSPQQHSIDATSVANPSDMLPLSSSDSETNGVVLRNAVAERVIALLDKMVGLWGVTTNIAVPPHPYERSADNQTESREATFLQTGGQTDSHVSLHGSRSAPLTASSSDFAEAVQRHIALDLLELLNACCGLQPIEVRVGNPLDETTMVAKYGEEVSNSSVWGCVSRELKWGYVDTAGNVYRPAEVAVYIRPKLEQ